MILNERQQQIMEMLAIQYNVSVSELSELFEVSAVTIRNDLNFLADEGYVVRTHGGARLVDGRKRQEFTFATRQRINAEQKQRIGELAATLVEEHEPILLDASSTVVAIARALKNNPEVKDVTAVTTGIWAALELLDAPKFNVVLAGGAVRSVTGSVTGAITRQVLDSFNFNKVFLGGWGLTLAEGAMDTHLAEVELKRTIVERAQNVIVALDGSKWGRVALASFAPIERITHIVTDDSAPAEMIAALRERGVEVLVATVEPPLSANTLANGSTPTE